MLLCHRLAIHGKDILASRLSRVGRTLSAAECAAEIQCCACLTFGNRQRKRRNGGVSSAAVASIESGGNGSRRDMASGGAAVTADAAPGSGGGEELEDRLADAGNKKSVGAQQNGLEKGTEADSEHGFSRAEFNSEPLVGSVNLYERHVFLCYKDPQTWPAQVEAADFDRLPRSMVAALRARKSDMPKKTRLTICEGRDGPDSSSGDVLIFPEMLRYRSLTHAGVDSFVENVLVNGKEWTTSKPESLSGSHIFVCCHGSRDKRCGVCGPMLVEKIREEIELRGLDDQIFVRPCSHVGGHKYAGNVIVFSSTGTETVSGHWYGYVAPTDVPVILDQHIGKGKIIDRLWRGQMGMNEADQKQALQNRSVQEDDSRKGCACMDSSTKTNSKAQNGSACCQSAATEERGKAPEFLQNNGSSTHDGHLMFLNDESNADEESSEPRIKLWGSRSMPLPKWTKRWEREDTHAVLAVVGAAAAVTVAIHIYRRSS